MEDEVSLYIDRARLALDDSKILLADSGSCQGIIGRAGTAMVHAGWAMLLSVGEAINRYEDVIPGLERRFGNNSCFYGFITGAKDVYLRAEFGPPVDATSHAANAKHAVSNADRFTTMAHEFVKTGDQRGWSVSSE